MRCSIRLLFAAGLVAAILPCARAAEWTIEPSVESHANITDNINLTPGVHDNVVGLTLSPRVTFARRTESTESSGTASVGINRFPGNSDLDTEDVNLSLKSKFSAERSSYGLSLAFLRDSTLQSELATTGVVQERRQRNLLSFAPSWNYALTDRSSVFAQYQYDQAHYQAGTGLEDYGSHQVTAGYQYAISERTSATLSGSYSHYRTDSGSVQADSYSLNTGLVYAASERLNFAGGIGVRRSETTFTQSALLCPFGPIPLCEFLGEPLVPVTASTESNDSGLTFNASVDYHWERSSISLAAVRDLNPTGSGLLVKTDRLSAQVTREFTEKLSGSAGASYLVSRYLGGVGADTDYHRLDLALSWKLDEWWNAGLSYSYANQSVKGTSQDASANTLMLSIGYNWPKISVSR